jgi:protein gp37
MAETTGIAWTDATFNPWWGCTKVAAGCQSCYADAFSKRTGRAVWGPNGTRIKTSEKNWREPVKWNREAERAGMRKRVFCASMADVFEDWAGRILTHEKEDGQNCVAWWRSDIGVCRAGQTTPGCVMGERLATMDDMRADLFKLIDATPWLDWLLLTKRPENIGRMWPSWHRKPTDEDYRGWSGDGPLESVECRRRQNVWLGTSVAEQADADKNIPLLLKCRELSPVLFLSCEPLVGPVDLAQAGLEIDLSGPLEDPAKVNIDWVIVGGESGNGARPCDVAWVRSIVSQCKAAEVPCFVKQLGNLIVEVAPGDDWPDLRLACPTRRRGWGDDRHIRIVMDKKGGDMAEWSEDLRVREFPEIARA